MDEEDLDWLANQSFNEYIQDKYKMHDYPFYDPNSMLAKRRKDLDKVRKQYCGVVSREDVSLVEPKLDPEFKPRPAVEKTRVKSLKEKISDDLNTVHGLLLEGIANMNADGVDDVYNVAKIRDLIIKVLRETEKET